MKRLYNFMVFVAILLTLGSCMLVDALFGSEEEPLIGIWRIDSSEPMFPNYDYLKFTATEYHIMDAERAIFESGTRTEITDTSFRTVITRADQEPSIIGNENFAEFIVNDKALSISWYDDATKVIKFVTFTATKTN